MKKIILSICLGLFPLSLSAGEMTGMVDYTGSSDFNQIKARTSWQFGLNWAVGLEGKYAKEDIFKDPVYALKTPLAFTSDVVSFQLAPFYYFKNTSDDQTYNAFGINGKLIMTLEDDSVNEIYSHAYIGAAFARQEGLLALNDGTVDNRYYSQAAYTLGLHKNFYRAFSFEALASAFQYPDGISKVEGWRGILDQQDLGALQTHEIVHELPKYALAGRLTRLWAEKRATLYASYRFAEFHTADPEHSVIVGNTFALTPWAQADIAYNHLRTVHNANKRDIFYAQVRFVF